MPGVRAHLSLTHTIGWFVDAQHTRDHLNFQLPLLTHPHLPKRSLSAGDQRLRMGISHRVFLILQVTKTVHVGGKSRGFCFFGFLVFVFWFLVLFWFFLACLHCLKADPPQRQLVLLLTLSFNIKRKKSCKGAKGLCQKEKHTGKLLFF